MSMTREEFYGDALEGLQLAERKILSLAQTYKDTVCEDEKIEPIVYCCSRIKSPESVLQKCRIRGIGETAEDAIANFYDLVGVRVICAFSADVYSVAEWLKGRPEIEVTQEKDYYAYPKPNGYRSYHMLLRTLPENTNAEIQIRTIATDFWATLEHQMKYKKEIADEKMIRAELKRCADEIASVDLSMQTIREIIQGSAE